MARRNRSSRRRLARGSSAPPLRREATTTGPVPVMDRPVSRPADPVGLQEASAAVRAVLAAARPRS